MGTLLIKNQLILAVNNFMITQNFASFPFELQQVSSKNLLQELIDVYFCTRQKIPNSIIHCFH
jgi:hypothetical protein